MAQTERTVNEATDCEPPLRRIDLWVAHFGRNDIQCREWRRFRPRSGAGLESRVRYREAHRSAGGERDPWHRITACYLLGQGGVLRTSKQFPHCATACRNPSKSRAT